MFAVIETGGKQHKVSVGDKIKIEKITAEEGSVFLFDKVLLIDDGKETMLGVPYINKAKVEAKVLAEGRLRKIIVFKIFFLREKIQVDGAPMICLQSKCCTSSQIPMRIV